MPLQKSPIRQLAWDYYLGKLETRDEYLRQRQQLVEAAILGETAAEPPPPEPTQEPDPTWETQTPDHESSAERTSAILMGRTSAQGSSPRLLLTALIIAAAISGGVTYLIANGFKQATAQATTTSAVEIPLLAPETLQKDIKSMDSTDR